MLIKKFLIKSIASKELKIILDVDISILLYN